MAFWVFLVLWVATEVLSVFLAPNPNANAPKASGLGDFQVPTIDPTRCIPIIAGTVLLRGPNVAWYGDLLVRPIYKEVDSGPFGLLSTSVLDGYQYFLGMQLALCQGPVDRFVAFWSDNAPVTSTTAALGDKLRVHMGTPARAFGVFNFGFIYDKQPVGDVDFYYGTASQTANDYLQAKTGVSLPGYRTVCYAVLRQVFVGKSPFIRDIAVEVAKFPNTLGLTGGNHIIAGTEANPAAFLYDVLVNQDWGAQVSSSRIDLASFQAAGNRLATEGLGISVQYDTAVGGEAIAQDLLRHMDGALFEHPATGLLTLKLAREDYDPTLLPVLDETMIRDVEITRGSWSELTNTVVVNYISRADAYTKRTAQQQNLAVIQVQGQRTPVSIDFLGASLPAVANFLAARSLKTVSYPIARMRIFLDRHAWQLTPGSVFKLNWAPEGIAGMIMRVASPSFGTMENGEITLEAVEDVFAIASTAFTPPPVGGWVPPPTTPTAIAIEQLIEVPYHLLGAADRRVAAMAVRPDGPDLGYQVWSEPPGSGTFDLSNTNYGFTPAGTLVGAYGATTAALDGTGFVIQAVVDAAQLVSVTAPGLTAGANLMLIDAEIVAWQTVTDNGDGTFTLSNVLRGVLDTVPAAHSAGARAWAIAPTGLGVLNPATPYPADGTAQAKLLPFNRVNVLPVGSATIISITTASRAQLPYPPGNMKIAGVTWPTSIPHAVDAAVTWAIRHRVAQFTAGVVVAQDAADFAAAPEGNYTVVVRVGGVIKRTVTAIVTTSWTWTAAFQAADGATAGTSISIRVYPVNGALTGTYQERLFTMT